MSSNAETLARVIIEIERILGEYLEPISEHDAKLAVEQIQLKMDRSDAVGTTQRVLSGYMGPTLVK
jgi:hypothetical protein